MYTWEGVLSMLSTLIGAGIVFTPFMVYQIGLFDGLVVFLVVEIISYVAVYQYMYVMTMIPFNVETIYDLSFLITKSRTFLLVVAVLMFVACSGMTVTYSILFARIS
jgi:amino acid permease